MGDYTTLNYPPPECSLVANYAFGIDNSDTIVGEYVDGGNVNHGFVLSGGGYTPLDPPALPQ
jgi:hypothetical protein